MLWAVAPLQHQPDAAIVLAGATGVFKRLLDLVRLDRLFDILPDLDQATEYGKKTAILKEANKAKGAEMMKTYHDEVRFAGQQSPSENRPPPNSPLHPRSRKNVHGDPENALLTPNSSSVPGGAACDSGGEPPHGLRISRPWALCRSQAFGCSP